jgi:hypothetical protein
MRAAFWSRLALEIYADTGASWDARRVRGRLRKRGVRRSLAPVERPDTGGRALTDSELEVVGLVSQGLTNRDVRPSYLSPEVPPAVGAWKAGGTFPSSTRLGWLPAWAGREARRLCLA